MEWRGIEALCFVKVVARLRVCVVFFFFQAEDGIRDLTVTGVQTCALPIWRTPKINSNAGRDHWPGCFSVTLAGAGIRGGMVYGASDRIAAFPSQSPVGPEEDRKSVV